jgi:hypothetical protein
MQLELSRSNYNARPDKFSGLLRLLRSDDKSGGASRIAAAQKPQEDRACSAVGLLGGPSQASGTYLDWSYSAALWSSLRWVEGWMPLATAPRSRPAQPEHRQARPNRLNIIWLRAPLRHAMVDTIKECIIFSYRVFNCATWGDAMARSDDREIDRTITNNLTQLSKYGVLIVRPGYEITDHQLTGRRAIVATVDTKRPKAGLDQDEVLPDNIRGTPAGVREANSYQRLRAIDPLAAKMTQTYRRSEEAEPEWPLEREIPSGELFTSARSETQRKLAAQCGLERFARARGSRKAATGREGEERQAGRKEGEESC